MTKKSIIQKTAAKIKNKKKYQKAFIYDQIRMYLKSGDCWSWAVYKSSTNIYKKLLCLSLDYPIVRTKIKIGTKHNYY